MDLKAVVRIATKNQKFLLNNSVFRGIKDREMKANKTPKYGFVPFISLS